MTASSEINSCHEPVVDLEFNLESVKSNKWFPPKNIKVTITQTINKSVKIFSNQDQIKMGVNAKNVVAISFMCPIIKVFHL